MTTPVTLRHRIVRDGRVLYRRGEAIHPDTAAALGVTRDGVDAALAATETAPPDVDERGVIDSEDER